MGGNELSAYGLAHLGDYEATVFSQYSRNRMFGEKFVRGERMDALAEGVSTAAALMVLKEKYQVDLPICTAVHTAIQGRIPPEELMSRLFLRSLKKEF
jgi:glycerol-3-phosphate dehydrogenase (NAD(P)+)